MTQQQWMSSLPECSSLIALTGLLILSVCGLNLLLSNNCRLQAFVDAVQSHVIARAPDLMKKEFDREGVKLHATLMNSRFPAAVAKTAAEREGRGVEGNWRKRENPGKIPPREPFDATKILRVCTHPNDATAINIDTYAGVQRVSFWTDVFGDSSPVQEERVWTGWFLQVCARLHSISD